MAQTKVKLVSNGVITVDNLHTNHGITTDHIGEGSVLYYTDARVQNYLSTNNYIKTTDVANLESVTSLSFNANVLSYVDEAGTTTNIDLSLYLDDTNLARIVSGSLNSGTGVATFTRDDSSTFTVDFSAFLSDANDYVTSASFNTSDGVLTLTRLGGGTVTVDLDNRYLTSFTETDPIYTASSWYTTTNNATNWDTAYGWGNHASAGYLTSYSETDTLATVTGRGNTTSNSIIIGGSTVGNSSGLSVQSTQTNSGPIVAKTSNYNTVWSILPWVDGTYISTGIYYDNGQWVHSSSDTKNALINFSGDGAKWYASNNSAGSWNLASNVSLWDSSGRWGNNVSAPSDVRAPIFYDSNNTGYYVDPSSTSKSANFNGNLEVYARSAAWAEGVRIRVPSTGTWGGVRWTRDRANYDGNWALGYKGAGDTTDDLIFWANNGGSEGDKARLTKDAHLTVIGSSRAPIFYDSNDTNYYVDPSALSRVRGIQIRGAASSQSTLDQIGFWDQTNGVPGTTSAIGFKQVGGIWADHGVTSGGYNTYFSMDTVNRGWIFRRVTAGGSDYTGVNVASIRNDGQAQFDGNVRSPIFYDSNNTGYYVDPASRSILADVETRNGINLRRDLGAATGISFYTTSYYNWQLYMSPAGQTGCGANGNLTAPSGLGTVTNWALRSRMEGVNTYGWLWETGGGGGGAATASAKMELGATTGTLRVTGDVIAYASDARLKTNINKIDNSLEKIKKISGVTYDWVDNIQEEYGFHPNSMHEVGVLAQEIQEVLPEAVMTAPMNAPYTQKTGKDHNFLTVQYEKIVPLLIEAIKEQQQQIEELKNLINK